MRQQQADRLAIMEWSGRAFWENAAAKVMLELLRQDHSVTREQVLEGLTAQLQQPENEFRSPAIREAISQIERYIEGQKSAKAA